MLVKTVNGRKKDVRIVHVTPENYIVPEKEKHMYHCIIEVRRFNESTGERRSIPRIQKFGKKGYENGIYENLIKQGNTVTVLHDPNEWLKEQSRKQMERSIEIEKKKAIAKESEILAQKEALKAEIMEELKESGIIIQPGKEERTGKEEKK